MDGLYPYMIMINMKFHVIRKLIVLWLLHCDLVLLVSSSSSSFIIQEHNDNDDTTNNDTNNDNDDVHNRRRNQWTTTNNNEQCGDDYYIGIAKSDMTGPAVQMNMMGYAPFGQISHGIHQRLYARAYIIGQINQIHPTVSSITTSIVSHENNNNNNNSTTTIERLRKQRQRNIQESVKDDTDHMMKQPKNRNTITNIIDPNTTICFVSVDIGMGSDLLNLRVIQRLSDLIYQNNQNNNHTFSSSSQRKQSQQSSSSSVSPCTIENLSISGTHTHFASGGYIPYALYEIPSLGYVEEVTQAYVEGIAMALYRAYQNIDRTNIQTAQSWLFGANRNRSPSSYIRNPITERNEYSEEGDTDKTMVQLTFHPSNGDDITNTDNTMTTTSNITGLINWFAVHGTSMNASNHLISGDNKGYASYLAEQYWNGIDTITGTGKIVAAFASTNLGDVSPNTAGPHCIDTGEPCDNVQFGNMNDTTISTCNNDCRLCRATGPGTTMLESCEIIGRLQYNHSLSLIQNPENQQFVQGDVMFRHSFIDMSNISILIQNNNSTNVSTCSAALGYAFAAGTTDGPGEYPFEQGTNTTTNFWSMLGGFLSIPTKEQVQCHAPKPILLNIGITSIPYPWVPKIVPISIFRIGQVFILNVPAEFTTMAGRRLRKAIYDIVSEHDIPGTPIVIIAGLANSYSGYVTTIEEYGEQRYEGASTLFGPHTLSAYIQEFQRLTYDLLSGTKSVSMDGPKDVSHRQISFSPPPILLSLDTIGWGRRYGSVVLNADDEYRFGETVKVTFRSANPRNNVRLGGTFLSVDILNETDGTWQTRYVDGDWNTQFYWTGGWSLKHLYWGTSYAEILWNIPNDTPTGMYRVCHFGTRQTLLGALELALYHNPVVWLTTTVLGSYAINVALHIFNFSYHISSKFRSSLHHYNIIQKKDFHGCSRTFLVH